MKIVRLILFLQCPLLSLAQDINLSQFYSQPVYLNPAFTGNTREHRFALSYRNQWPSISKAFVSQCFSYDYSADRLNSGFGLVVTNDKAGTMGYRSTSAGLTYGYQLKLSRTVGLNGGMSFAYGFHDIDKSRLVFNDQLYRQSSTSFENVDYQTGRYLDIGSGVLLYGAKSWLGFSGQHINQPNESVRGSDAVLPFRYSLHGGHELKGRKSQGKKSTAESVQAAFNYQAQQDYDELALGLYYNYSRFIIGGWYRGLPGIKSYRKGYQNNDALIAMVGYEINNNLSNLRIGYSYDITMSRLATNSGGAHEISLIYEIAQKKKRKRLFVPCAKF